MRNILQRSVILAACTMLALTGCNSAKKTGNNGDFTIEDGVLTAYTGDGGDVVIPDGVTIIEKDAFQDVYSLKSISIPDSVVYIYEEAFLYCPNLTSITVDEGNVVYDSRDNCNAIIETENNSLIVGCQNTVIPDGVTGIGFRSLMHWCQTSLELPSSVTSIGDLAFESTCLTSIEIPAGVTAIGDRVFEGCSDITSITVDENNTVYDSRDNCNAIIKTENNYLIQGCQNTVIPEGVTRIGDYAFSGCDSMTSIEIPASVKMIDACAFDNCLNLTDIYYSGTEEEWNKIAIFDEQLQSATLHTEQSEVPQD